MPSDDDPTGMSEDDIMDAMEDLYRAGKVEHVPGIGSDVDPAFALTDQGVEDAENLLAENDEAALYAVQLHLGQVGKVQDEETLLEALVDVGEFLRDGPGVNVFRLLERHSGKHKIGGLSDLPEDFVEAFDDA